MYNIDWCEKNRTATLICLFGPLVFVLFCYFFGLTFIRSLSSSPPLWGTDRTKTNPRSFVPRPLEPAPKRLKQNIEWDHHRVAWLVVIWFDKHEWLAGNQRGGHNLNGWPSSPPPPLPRPRCVPFWSVHTQVLFLLPSHSHFFGFVLTHFFHLCFCLPLLPSPHSLCFLPSFCSAARQSNQITSRGNPHPLPPPASSSACFLFFRT